MSAILYDFVTSLFLSVNDICLPSNIYSHMLNMWAKIHSESRRGKRLLLLCRIHSMTRQNISRRPYFFPLAADHPLACPTLDLPRKKNIIFIMCSFQSFD